MNVTRPARVGTYVLIGIVLYALFVLMTTPLVHAVESGGVGGRPANPDASNARTNSIFVYEIKKGESKQDAVKVFNNSDSKKTIQVYATDATTGSGGSFACKQRVDDKTGVGSWIDIDTQSFTLEPQQSKEIPFELTVPDDTVSGEQDGCIAIEDVSQTPTDTGNGVTISTRSAIRVAVLVPGQITKGIDILSLSVKKEDALKLALSLRNNGNVSLDTDIDISVRNLGIEIAQAGGTFPVLSGVKSDYNFSVDRPFWGGLYQVVAEARYNDSKGAVLGVGEKDATVSKSSLIFIAPTLPALLIELLFIGLLAWFARRLFLHRKERAIWAKNATNYTVKAGDDIQSIAAEHGMKWQVLARMNKLKAPYHLNTGQTLSVINKHQTLNHKPSARRRGPTKQKG
jgi:hypothetical protein